MALTVRCLPTVSSSPNGLRRAAAFGLLGLVAGCGSAPAGRGAADDGGSARPVARGDAGSRALAVERAWLQDWFRGTPVAIAQAEDGSVMVAVPREFSFEPGRSEPRPALVAVLDKVAESLRRVPSLRLATLAAPADAAGASPSPATGAAALALERARRVQRHLQTRGVAPVRLGRPSAGTAAAVQLRLVDGAAAP